MTSGLAPACTSTCKRSVLAKQAANQHVVQQQTVVAVFAERCLEHEAKAGHKLAIGANHIKNSFAR